MTALAPGVAATTELHVTLASAALFLGMYKLSPRLSPLIIPGYKTLEVGKQRDWDSRWGSTVHALITTALSAYFVCFTDSFTDDPATGRVGSIATTPETTTLISFSLGYFLLDFALIVSSFPSLGGLAMVAHHIIGIACLLTALVNSSAHSYAVGGMVMEITTPFINVFWVLKELDRKSSPVFMVNGVLLVLLWLVFRILLAIPGGFYIYSHYNELVMMPLYGKVLVVAVPVSLFVLNVMWFHKLAAGAIKMLKAKPKQG